MKKIIRIAIVLSIITLLITWMCNYIIIKKSAPYIYTDTQTIPYNEVGLLLGTSKHLRSGALNQYFFNRIEAATQLYNSGKIKYVVVSGDNSREAYNEPLDMKNELMQRGIPDSVIYLDYAGFRTFDSVIRMHKIFGQSSFTIISQQFHNQRAIYIAQRKGLTAYGYNAQDVSAYNGFKTQVREKFARVKVFTDLLIGKQPKFLGDTIVIGVNPPNNL